MFTFRLPSHKHVFIISSKERLNDNKWHLVSVERNKRKAILTIDNKSKYLATFDKINYIGYGNLATDGYIRVGGYRRLPFGLNLKFYAGFNGCIADFKLDDRLIDLVTYNLNNRYFPSVCSYD